MGFDEAQRESLVAGYTATGMPTDRARLIVDIAAQAALDAVETVKRKAKLAPDTTAYLATLSLSLQLAKLELEAAFAGLLIATLETPGGIEGTRIVPIPEKAAK